MHQSHPLVPMRRFSKRHLMSWNGSGLKSLWLIRQAFTLVELLVVMAIIAIIAALAVPTINTALVAARESSIRLEIASIERAVEQYFEKFGDYPPDFSDPAVATRHYNKIFPRLGNNDRALLRALLFTGPPATAGGAPTFSADAMDRAEALVFTLGGYSDNPQRPFTGDGGPLEWIGDGTDDYEDAAVTDAERQDPANFQINIDRPNAFHSFEPSRLNYSAINSSAPITGANRYVSQDDNDLFLSYAAIDNGAPIIYFDSRTYTTFANYSGAMPGNDFNRFASDGFGGIRPFLSELVDATGTFTGGSEVAANTAAIQSIQFVNPDTYQILSAGLDDNFGAAPFTMASDPADRNPVYFQFPSGAAVSPSATSSGVGMFTATLNELSSGRYQESSFSDEPVNFQVDNITSFATRRLDGDIE